MVSALAHFPEVHVAVPEPGRNRAARTIELLGGWRDLHLRPATHRSYLSALNEHHAVLYGVVRGIDIDRPSNES